MLLLPLLLQLWLVLCTPNDTVVHHIFFMNGDVATSFVFLSIFVNFFLLLQCAPSIIFLREEQKGVCKVNNMKHTRVRCVYVSVFTYTFQLKLILETGMRNVYYECHSLYIHIWNVSNCFRFYTFIARIIFSLCYSFFRFFLIGCRELNFNSFFSHIRLHWNANINFSIYE